MIYDFIETVSKHSSDIDPPYPQGFSELDKSFHTTSEQISFGQSSIDDAITQFMNNAKSILGKSQ